MGITIAWEDDTKRVMRYSLDENWTWEEFFAAKKQANEMMDSVAHKFGVIIEAPATPTLPPNIMSNARKGLRSTHPNTVVVVIVAAHPLVRTMLHTTRALGRIANLRVELASTLDEARAIIDARLHTHDSARLC